MADLKQSTAYNRTFFMIDSTNRPAGKSGLTITVRISKNGAASVVPLGTISEIDATNMPGWYMLQLQTGDTGTLGDLAYKFTATGADPTNFSDQVRANILGDPLTLTSAYDFAKGTAAVAESYAANGVAPTPIQALMAIHQMLMSFAISGTSINVKKLDNSTAAFTASLDSASAPTRVSRP